MRGFNSHLDREGIALGESICKREVSNINQELTNRILHIRSELRLTNKRSLLFNFRSQNQTRRTKQKRINVFERSSKSILDQSNPKLTVHKTFENKHTLSLSLADEI
jgi:hypothetical protein